MTGLRELHLESSIDHLLVPHLLLVLQGQCCVVVESIYIGPDSSITAQQLSELVSRCPRLATLYCLHCSCISNVVLVELACNCLHLQTVKLCFSEVTEEDILALAVHCRQLREINLFEHMLTEETVRQLAQHLHHLTKLNMSLYEKQGEVMVECCRQYSRKEIRALRETVRQRVRALNETVGQRDRALNETVRQRVRDSSNAEVITLRSNNTCCIIL